MKGLHKSKVIGPETASGRRFNLESPSVADVHLPDIATSISRQNRYLGHTFNTYSVAEHSYWCWWLARKDGNTDPTFLRTVLMHDAHEAYVGDMPRPVKLLCPDFVALEQRVQDAVYARFGLGEEFGVGTNSIKYYDNAITRAESRAMMTSRGEDWDWDGVPVVDVPFFCWDADVARFHFLEACEIAGVH